MATINDIEGIYKTNFTGAISSISYCSKDKSGDILVKDSSECINYDDVKDNGKFNLCSVDALYFNINKKCLYFIEFKNRDISSIWWGEIFDNSKRSAEASILLHDYIEYKYGVIADNDIKKVFVLVSSKTKSATYFSKVARCRMTGTETHETNLLQNALYNRNAFGKLFDDVQIVSDQDFKSFVL